ncbi:DUF397 domain-containing protein [Umezawaea sp. Da 62-37]|uniref:DUF397 domain-containing protein n=1 Tax=Umezawaea sp. Da 62-37 TaxID=3075927 RepID=UPI0028F72C47|nr:DUF397 domain-containing protein [Umezawaea sp. Da 62-37]WNV82254.1 DUF397 domain-containing protein [Umezawaea sp. Da 62-37]
MANPAPAQLDGARWRKSSRTNGGNDAQCVELACLAEGAAVRDSKHPGPALLFPANAFAAFLVDVKRGNLDPG